MPVGNKTDPETGLEVGFAAMHLGHFALLEQMEASGVLAASPRVVMVSSAALGLGGFDATLHTGVGGEGDLRGEITIGCPFNTPAWPVTTLPHLAREH